MRIKQKLPWSMDSPSIHLVQPSDRVPMIHEVVSRQPSVSENDTILFTLTNQEWKIPKPLKREVRSHSNIEESDSKKGEYALKCGYISPTIHSDLQPRRSSSFDLRIGQKSAKDEQYNGRSSKPSTGKLSVHKTNSDGTGVKSNSYLSNTSTMTESSQDEDRRKSLANFNDILKELQLDVCSRTNSETESCGAKTPTLERKRESKSYKIITREDSLESTESNEVFYDIELNTEEKDQEKKPVKISVRKSFSEETFDQSRRFALQQKRNEILKNEARRLRTISSDSCDDWCEEMWKQIHPRDTRRVSQMVDELLLEIYGAKTCMLARRRSCIGRLRHSSVREEDSSEWLEGSGADENPTPNEEWRRKMLQKKDICELQELLKSLQTEIKRFGSRLVRHLKRRDCFIAKRELHCDWITAYLQANSEKRSEDTRTRFSVTPGVGDSGFTQWVSGMRMVARLPEGIPQQFRKTLWLNLAEKHLASRGVNWQEVEEFCFNEFTNPDDEELGVQIVKDVHRTGCSLFCGTSGQHNQAVLKRVLLAYARWNKAVGYCQGFNMLAALILQVMDKSEVDSVKVMIFLIEGVLPESYFANNLRGLSVDMAVFRDLLRLKLPSLSRHLEQLQNDSKDSGTSYEPPLTNVFTMQWFLTLFCNCLPQETVLRVWDLIFLEGNQILLCTALAIWNTLSDRIMSVESADEFYSIMGVLTREMLEFGLMDANNLIKAIVSINFPELGEMRERYLYNITPWTQSVSTVARRGLRLFYSDDDTDNEEEDEKIAIATAYGLFRSPKKKEQVPSGITSPPKTVSNFGSHPDREKIAMDISALKKQYCKLRERQRQAHIILTAACGGQTLVGPTTSPAMNHLLLGKCALVNNKGRRLGPPQGSIPPPSKSKVTPGEIKTAAKSGETLHWKDTAEASSKHSKQQPSGTKTPESVSSPSSNNSSRRGSSSSTSTELCDDPQKLSDSEDQTNSLSECYIIAENLQEQDQKEDQPILVDTNIKKEIKTLVEQNVAEITSLENPKNVLDLPEKDDYDIYKETAAKTRRKSSFKIDLQEIKEIDRKLSLKISEIERASFEKRRSIIGISPPSQGDIDSQVLFPFDRDYIKEEALSRNQSSETEENESNINDRSQTETILESESLSIGECIQMSVNFIEQEKLYNVVTSCDSSEAVIETSHTNTLLENMNEKLLEISEKSVSEELKDCRPTLETNYTFNNSYKSDFEDQIISGNNDDIFNTLSEEQSSKIETNEKVRIQTDSNSETSYLILGSNEEHVASIDREEINQNVNSDHILRTSPVSVERDNLSPKESEFKYTFNDQDLNCTNLENQQNFQVEKSPQISGTRSPENKSYFDKSPSCRNTLIPSEYETLKLSTEDVPDIEEEQIKHQAARRGSEIALSMILEENLQILSKFQLSKKSSILLDKEGCDEEDSLPESFAFTKQSEYFNLSKENEEEIQSVNSGNAQLFDSKLLETDSFQLSNVKTKVSSSHLTDEQFHTFSDLSWFSDEKKLIKKDNLKSVLDKTSDFTSETNVQKDIDIMGVKNLEFENENHKLESYKKCSFPQYKYKYDVKGEEGDALKEETKVVENFSDMAKSEPFETSLLQKDVTDNGKLLLKKEDNLESLEFNYGAFNNKIKYDLQDFLKEEEGKEIGKHGTERGQTKSDLHKPNLDTQDKDNGILLYKDEDRFDSSEFKYETLRSQSKYDPVTSKLFCRRQTSLDYSPKSKLSGFSFQGNNERRTSLSLDSGTTLKEESRRTSTTEPEGETDISNFSSFKFYSPVISELEYKNENFNDTSPIQDVVTTKENSRITTEEGTLAYSKRLGLMDTIDRNKKEGHLTDTFDLELQSHSSERLKKESFYSDFKVSDTKDITEIKTDKLYKPTFSFDCDNQDKEYKPRYSSLSPRRKKFVDVDMEPNYLSSPSLERFRSPSPSKFSTSHFETGFSVTDEKLKASSYRLSTLKSEKGTDCDTKDSDTKFMYDNLDITLRLGNKSTSESKYESYEHTKSSDTYLGSSPTSPTRFNPFPSRTLSRQPKELGVKLGLYQPPKLDKSPSKRFS